MCTVLSSPMVSHERWFPCPPCTPPVLDTHPFANSSHGDRIPGLLQARRHRDPAPTLKPRAGPGYTGSVPNWVPLQQALLDPPSSPLPPEARRKILEFLFGFPYQRFRDHWARCRIVGSLHGVRPYVPRGAPLPEVPRQ